MNRVIQPIRQSAQIGLYGKVPALGDFLSRGFDPVTERAIDHWMASGLQALALQDSDWETDYANAPLWRFACEPGVFGQAALAGVLLPSCDRVGRCFPLAIAVQMHDLQGHASVLCHDSAWFDALEALAFSSRDEAFSLDLLMQRLHNTRMPDLPRSSPAHPFKSGDGNASTIWWRQDAACGKNAGFRTAGVPGNADFVRLFAKPSIKKVIKAEPPPSEQPLHEGEIARHFETLVAALHKAGDRGHDLTDRLRDALDRRVMQLRPRTSFIVNSFSVEQSLHEGERFSVTRLRHRDLETVHAMKTVQPLHGRDGAASQLLLREAGMMQRVHHANVVALQAALRLDDGRPALIMADCGVSLDKLLRYRRIDRSFIDAVLHALLAGLGAIHDAGMVHCDIAPANLLLIDGNPETLAICDFGIALDAGARHGRTGLKPAGRPHYAPPEQLRGEAVSPASDLYAAGRVIEKLLSLSFEPVDARLRNFVGHTTLMDPSRRPQDVWTALMG